MLTLGLEMNVGTSDVSHSLSIKVRKLSHSDYRSLEESTDEVFWRDSSRVPLFTVSF
jgi:hypothetical protein